MGRKIHIGGYLKTIEKEFPSEEFPSGRDPQCWEKITEWTQWRITLMHSPPAVRNQRLMWVDTKTSRISWSRIDAINASRVLWMLDAILCFCSSFSWPLHVPLLGRRPYNLHRDIIESGCQPRRTTLWYGGGITPHCITRCIRAHAWHAQMHTHTHFNLSYAHILLHTYTSMHACTHEPHAHHTHIIHVR